jgi:AraC family transcriptional activator of tynA and feaB
MRLLLTTSQVHPRDRFQFWQNAIFERIVPLEQKKVGEQPFTGVLEGAEIGPLCLTRITKSALRTEATPEMIRRHDKHEKILVVIMLSGTQACTQMGREAVQQPGELVVLDQAPTIMQTEALSRSLVLEIPRERLERMLGPASLYAGLTVGAGQASTSLVTNFFGELTRVQERLNSELAARMSSIGIDLIVASLSERMALETPKPLAGTLLVHRAKAYVEANLGDPTLDPSQLALAVGISLRRLQQLFQERNENIADWIWEQRLKVAASQLLDPGTLSLSIGALAYNCGFINQSHFSRRFKDRYGMPPGEYRAGAIKMR